MKRWKLILAGALCFSAISSAGYEGATLHHGFANMKDLDGNGVPDSMDSYLAASGVTLPDPYDPKTTDLDEDGMEDFGEWVLGTDPLAEEEHFGTSTGGAGGTGMVLRLALPDYFGGYAEVFGCESLLDGQWEVYEGWIPTYGAEELELVVATESNSAYFLMGFDATWDWDGDGYSDFMEYYISHTDDEVFNHIDSDLDGLHDWWELKLFGDLSQSGTDDFDGDTLLNNEELVWLSASNIVMVSDPSLYDSDADTLNDAEEIPHQTNPMEADTDKDGLDDAAELSDRTDPCNPDVAAPVITLNF